MRTESLALLAAIFFSLTCNHRFWQAILAGHTALQPATWGLALAVLVLLTTSNFILLGLILNRWTAKPLLALLLVATAFAVYFIEHFGIYLDQGMLRNALHTDWLEAHELFTWSILPYLLGYAVLPLLFLTRVHLRTAQSPNTFLIRFGALALALTLGCIALLFSYQGLSSVLRNQKEVRYLITPLNYLYALAKLSTHEAHATEIQRFTVGSDAHLGSSWSERKKPVLFVLVIGETVRAANWGLSGYARQTTPELSKLAVINFPKVTACGTNTEVSLPCMLSAVGRRAYDEERIRSSESLLHVLAHAGFKVLWRDNQAGCKGSCAGLPEQRLASAQLPGLCDGERCLDGILLHGLDSILADGAGNRFIVLHMLGNHGPSYYRRYPAAYHRFLPSCENPDLARCTSQEIINAYDNALLYTDSLLAQTIDFLQAQASKMDTVLLYVSDHGESLGEHHLYLHGLPYAIAPKEQTTVPLMMWFSKGYYQNFGIDRTCLETRARQPAAHDHLFHTILGLLDIATTAYESAYDLSAGCRRPDRGHE
jgi:lipid A ethanolaminephosphotransferase